MALTIISEKNSDQRNRLGIREPLNLDLVVLNFIYSRQLRTPHLVTFLDTGRLSVPDPTFNECIGDLSTTDTADG
jgi:hypothetical protein